MLIRQDSEGLCSESGRLLRLVRRQLCFALLPLVIRVLPLVFKSCLLILEALPCLINTLFHGLKIFLMIVSDVEPKVLDTENFHSISFQT